MSKKADPDKIFVENSKASDSTVKRHFIELVDYICTECGCSNHNGKSIALQLDHINGTHTDCRFGNLRLLCPNCHSQTDTFAGRQHWKNVVVTDEEFISALEHCKTITAALLHVKMDTGRTEYYGRANLLISKYGIVVGCKKDTFNDHFE